MLVGVSGLQSVEQLKQGVDWEQALHYFHIKH